MTFSQIVHRNANNIRVVVGRTDCAGVFVCVCAKKKSQRKRIREKNRTLERSRSLSDQAAAKYYEILWWFLHVCACDAD